jgi:hypothetical protein
VCCFQAQCLPGVSFLAHGLDDGNLVISQVGA